MKSKAIVRELTRLDRPALERHFLSLGSDDRRLRFGIALSDRRCARTSRASISARCGIRGSGRGLHLLGAAHLARGKGYAELGISVLPGHRGRGIGGALLARAHTHARNWGVRTLFMHCLTENGAIMHLARKQGMQIAAEAGEADAKLLLPPADALSYLGAAFEQRVALFDHALKTQLASAKRLAEALTSRTQSPAQKNKESAGIGAGRDEHGGADRRILAKALPDPWDGDAHRGGQYQVQQHRERHDAANATLP